ncbi:hypothetical protein WDW86_18240, partial [Bdellovibrionota bacterium FG-2]
AMSTIKKATLATVLRAALSSVSHAAPPNPAANSPAPRNISTDDIPTFKIGDAPEQEKTAPSQKIAHPQAPAAPQTSATTSTPVTTSNTDKPGQLLWDAWFTVAIEGTIRYQYYNERVEIRGNRIFFQYQSWKNEEGFINEEQLGAVSEKNAELTPVFFNYHSAFKNNEVTIDGTLTDGKFITTKIRKTGVDFPPSKRALPQKMIWSQFFPVWLGLKLPSLKTGQGGAFLAFAEDNPDPNAGIEKGLLRLEKPDDRAQRTKTKRLVVEFRGLRSVWWVEPNGCVARIELPTQKAVVQRVPEAEAKKFFESQ